MKYYGVIEGFHGRPWQFNQRKNLVNQFVEFGGLNTYVYAPKDDLKHRQKWRKLYSKIELNELSQLVNYCKNNDIIFIYAISPGLDISYSSKPLFCKSAAPFSPISHMLSSAGSLGGYFANKVFASSVS